MYFGQLEAAKMKLEEAVKEQEALVDIFAEERSRRDKEEANLRRKLKVRKLQPCSCHFVNSKKILFNVLIQRICVSPL